MQQDDETIVYTNFIACWSVSGSILQNCSLHKTVDISQDTVESGLEDDCWGAPVEEVEGWQGGLANRMQ